MHLRLVCPLQARAHTVCSRVCLYTCAVPAGMRTCARMCKHPCMFVHVRACMHTCVRAYVRACVHACMRANACACVRICMCMRMYTSSYMCVCVCLRACLCFVACAYVCACACACVHICGAMWPGEWASWSHCYCTHLMRLRNRQLLSACTCGHACTHAHTRTYMHILLHPHSHTCTHTPDHTSWYNIALHNTTWYTAVRNTAAIATPSLHWFVDVHPHAMVRHVPQQLHLRVS